MTTTPSMTLVTDPEITVTTFIRECCQEGPYVTRASDLWTAFSGWLSTGPYPVIMWSPQRLGRTLRKLRYEKLMRKLGVYWCGLRIK